MTRPSRQESSTRPPEAPHAGHVIEPMLTLKDLTAIVNCSRRKLEQMKAAGRLPKPDLHVGRCLRWKPETIRRWIDGGGR
jgi:hypothetical protein